MAQGAGGEKGSAVQAGLSAQPLVTSAADVINPSATEQLTDAFRKGFLTADDVIKRIGPVGQAQDKANVLALNEFASPEQIAARRAQAEAALSGSQLQTAQNQASEPLVSPLAQKAKADIWQKNALDTYQEHYGVPLYVKDNQGNDTDQPDIKTMASKGAEIIQAKQAIGYANSMLQGSWQVRKDKDGTAHEVLLNKMGQDVTPVKGNPWYDHFSDLQMQGEQVVFQPRSVNPNDVNWHPTPPKPGEAASAPNTAQPSADLIQPYVPGTGIVSGPQPGTTDAEKIAASLKLRSDVKGEKAYELWDAQRGYAQGFDAQAKRIDAIPAAQQKTQPMNTLDLGLAESIIKLFDPTAAIREFKWSKMSDSQPLKERLDNWKAELLKTGTFTPEARNRLIDLGYDTIRSKEQAVAQHLIRARELADKYPNQLDKSAIIGKEDENLANGIFTTRAATPAAAASSASPNIITLPSGRKGYLDANGQFHDSP